MRQKLRLLLQLLQHCLDLLRCELGALDGRLVVRPLKELVVALLLDGLSPLCHGAADSLSGQFPCIVAQTSIDKPPHLLVERLAHELDLKLHDLLDLEILFLLLDQVAKLASLLGKQLADVHLQPATLIIGDGYQLLCIFLLFQGSMHSLLAQSTVLLDGILSLEYKMLRPFEKILEESVKGADQLLFLKAFAG